MFFSSFVEEKLQTITPQGTGVSEDDDDVWRYRPGHPGRLPDDQPRPSLPGGAGRSSLPCPALPRGLAPSPAQHRRQEAQEERQLPPATALGGAGGPGGAPALSPTTGESKMQISQL